MNVYVAGPFTEDPEIWTEICTGIGYTLMKMGVNAIVPHMMTGAWDGTDLDYEDYMRLDLNVIETWADAIFYVASSPGADREKAACEWQGKPVLHSWREFYEWYRTASGRMGTGGTEATAETESIPQERDDSDVHSQRSDYTVAGNSKQDYCPGCGKHRWFYRGYTREDHSKFFCGACSYCQTRLG